MLILQFPAALPMRQAAEPSLAASAWKAGLTAHVRSGKNRPGDMPRPKASNRLAQRQEQPVTRGVTRSKPPGFTSNAPNAVKNQKGLIAVGGRS